MMRQIEAINLILNLCLSKIREIEMDIAIILKSLFLSKTRAAVLNHKKNLRGNLLPFYYKKKLLADVRSLNKIPSLNITRQNLG